MIAAVRAVQPLVVSLLMLGACAAKLVGVLRGGSTREALKATGLFPARLRTAATVVLSGCELVLGAGLIVTAGWFSAGLWANGARLAAGIFFALAACALLELRERKPDAACGCFGGLSTRPVGARSIARACMLACAALGSVGVQPLQLPAARHAALAYAGIIIGELLLFAAVSPETGEALLRLSYSRPCELRPLVPDRALAALRRSRAWRRYSAMLTSDVPEDMWRELCWWFAVYPARDGGGDRRVLFAVEVRPHRPAILAAVTEPAEEERSLSLSNAV